MKHFNNKSAFLLVIGGLAVLSLSLLAGVSAAQAVDVSLPSALPRYKVTDLGTLGGHTSRAYAINDVGQVVGHADLPDGPGSHAFLWQEGTMRDLGSLDGYFGHSTAYDINNLGYVVGSTDVEEDYAHPFVWYGGGLIQMHTLGGPGAAYSINEDNWIGGTSKYQNSVECAVEWAVGGDAKDLNDWLPAGSPWRLRSGHIYNQLGQYAVRGCIEYECHAFILEHDGLTDLGTLGGSYSSPEDINASGQVVGTSSIPSGHFHAFLWQNGTMTDLGTLGNNASRANAVNNAGLVVGDIYMGGGTIPSHAFVWAYDKMSNLNDLIPSDSGWVLASARDINENGQIVGYGVMGGLTHAFLLTPLLQPSALPTQEFIPMPTRELHVSTPSP